MYTRLYCLCRHDVAETHTQDSAAQRSAAQHLDVVLPSQSCRTCRAAAERSANRQPVFLSERSKPLHHLSMVRYTFDRSLRHLLRLG